MKKLTQETYLDLELNERFHTLEESDQGELKIYDQGELKIYDSGYDYEIRHWYIPHVYFITDDFDVFKLAIMFNGVWFELKDASLLEDVKNTDRCFMDKKEWARILENQANLPKIEL